MQGEAITGMRSSLCLLGALLGRCGYVTMEHPGGCIIGERPIDLHIRALQQMGVEFREEEGLLSAQVKDGKMHGAEITLEFPSVGATENILLAAVKADGDTRILGAAREPEVTALCEFLTACGAQIEGIGETELLVHGDRPLHGTQFTVPADRIVAGTYLFACIGCGGSTLLTEAPWEQMEAVTFVAEKMGAQCIASEEGLFVQCSKRPQAYHICGLGHTRSSPRICSRLWRRSALRWRGRAESGRRFLKIVSGLLWRCRKWELLSGGTETCLRYPAAGCGEPGSVPGICGVERPL